MKYKYKYVGEDDIYYVYFEDSDDVTNHILCHWMTTEKEAIDMMELINGKEKSKMKKSTDERLDILEKLTDVMEKYNIQINVMEKYNIGIDALTSPAGEIELAFKVDGITTLQIEETDDSIVCIEASTMLYKITKKREGINKSYVNHIKDRCFHIFQNSTEPITYNEAYIQAEKDVRARYEGMGTG